MRDDGDNVIVGSGGLTVNDWEQKMLDQAKNPDPLDPELEEYLEDDGDMVMIRHPLVYSIMHAPVMNWQVNKQLHAKKEMLADLRDEKNWFIYVMLAYERPWRLHALKEIEDELSDEQYWKLLADVWIDSENIWQHLDEWRERLTEDRENRHAMMDDDDKQCFDMLPDEFAVYRGIQERDDEVNEDGLSWTTDKVRGKWFAKRWLSVGDTCWLAQGVVSKKDVIAHFNGRGESEIVILPEDVRDVTITEIVVEEKVPTS